MIRKIFFHPERCMLCQSCVLACEMESLGVSNPQEIPYYKSPHRRMNITFSNGTPWVWKCQQCASAPCVEACVNGSLSREDEKTMVTHDRESCIGCGSCLLVCPYGALFYDEKEQKVYKCNLCPKESVPPCVRACQSKALVLEETERFLWGRRKKFVQESRLIREGD